MDGSPLGVYKELVRVSLGVEALTHLNTSPLARFIGVFASADFISFQSMMCWVVFYVFARKVPRTNRSGHYAYMLSTRCMGVLGMLESFLTIRTTLYCRLSRIRLAIFSNSDATTPHPLFIILYDCGFFPRIMCQRVCLRVNVSADDSVRQWQVSQRVCLRAKLRCFLYIACSGSQHGSVQRKPRVLSPLYATMERKNK